MLIDGKSAQIRCTELRLEKLINDLAMASITPGVDVTELQADVALVKAELAAMRIRPIG